MRPIGRGQRVSSTEVSWLELCLEGQNAQWRFPAGAGVGHGSRTRRVLGGARPGTDRIQACRQGLELAAPPTHSRARRKGSTPEAASVGRRHRVGRAVSAVRHATSRREVSRPARPSPIERVRLVSESSSDELFRRAFELPERGFANRVALDGHWDGCRHHAQLQLRALRVGGVARR